MTEKPKHNHAEAFCLMWYACDCGHRERIWNSRDGVTPFSMTCPSCGSAPRGQAVRFSSLMHERFDLDEYAPNHILAKDQRFWRDGTRDEAIAIVKKRAENSLAAGRPIPQAIFDALLADAEAGRGTWVKGWPILGRAL